MDEQTSMEIAAWHETPVSPCDMPPGWLSYASARASYLGPPEGSGGPEGPED